MGGGAGGGRWGEEVEKIFSGHSIKGRKKFSGHKPINLRVKKIFRTDSC